MTGKLLTVRDVADVLQKKPAAVRALANRGELAFYRIGREIRFAEPDLDVYLGRQRREVSDPEVGEKAVRRVLAGL